MNKKGLPARAVSFREKRQPFPRIRRTRGRAEYFAVVSLSKLARATDSWFDKSPGQ